MADALTPEELARLEGLFQKQSEPVRYVSGAGIKTPAATKARPVQTEGPWATLGPMESLGGGKQERAAALPDPGQKTFNEIMAENNPARPRVTKNDFEVLDQKIEKMAALQEQRQQAQQALLGEPGPGEQRLKRAIGARLAGTERDKEALRESADQRKYAEESVGQAQYESLQAEAAQQEKIEERYWDRAAKLTETADIAEDVYERRIQQIEEASKYRGYGESKERLNALFRMRDSGDPEMAKKANAELKRLKSKDPVGADALAILGMVLSLGGGGGAAVGGIINSYINRKVAGMERLAQGHEADYKKQVNMFGFFREQFGSVRAARDAAAMSELKALQTELAKEKAELGSEEKKAQADAAIAAIEDEYQRRAVNLNQTTGSEVLGRRAQLAGWEQERQGALAAAQAGKPPPSAVLRDIGGKLNALRRLHELEAGYHEVHGREVSGLIGRLMGRFSDDPTAEYEDLRQFQSRIIGRMYETGKFSDQDAKFWAERLPPAEMDWDRGIEQIRNVRRGLLGEVTGILEAYGAVGYDVESLYKAAQRSGYTEEDLSGEKAQDPYQGKW